MWAVFSIKPSEYFSHSGAAYNKFIINKVNSKMMKDGKYITSLNSEEALDFIMQSDQFHNFELPEYFDFTTVLQHVRSKVGELSYDECIAVDAVSDIDGISSRKCS